MERIGTLLNQVSQATDLQGHSVTLRQDERVCSCGKKFTAYIRVVDGVDDLDGLTLCRKCLHEKDFEEFKRQRLAELPALQIEGRTNWQATSGLPSLFLKKTFENFDTTIQPRAFTLMRHWGKEHKNSVVLLSPNLYGVGKTHLVAALITDLIEQTEPVVFDSRDASIRFRHCPAYFTTENNLLARIRDTFNSGLSLEDEGYENEAMIYSEMSITPLLIIDDVGKVRPRDYSFLQGVYFRIIDGRYTNQQPIILTTNLDYAELENHIGGACADRLREMCGDKGFIRMTGKSYRQKRGKDEVSPKD